MRNSFKPRWARRFFSFALVALAALLSASVQANANRICGGVNQVACPKAFPGPQCKKGLNKVGKYCRRPSTRPIKPIRPGQPVKPFPQKCGTLNRPACNARRCNRPLIAVRGICRRLPVKPFPRKCGTLNKPACRGNRCNKPLVPVRGICYKLPINPIIGQPGNAKGDKDSVFKRVTRVARAHREHIRIMKRFRSCMIRNKRALDKAARRRDTKSADRLKNKCLSSRDQARLRQSNITGKGSRSRSTNFQSLNVGLGADIAAAFGAGVDAGFVWDLNGRLPTRLYLGGSSGKGIRVGGGAGIRVGINLDPNIAGVSKYQAGSIGVGGAIDLGVALVVTREGPFLYAPARGLEISAGVGLGVNAGSVDRIKVRIFRRSCRNVQISVTNKRRKKIRILDLNYYDRGKRRSEPTPNRTVKPGKSRDVWRRPHDLGKVGYEQTELELVYRYNGRKYKKKFGSGICTDEKRFSVSVP